MPAIEINYGNCGLVPTSADLPNVSGSAYTATDLSVGDFCFVCADSRMYYCTNAASGAATWTCPEKTERVIVGTWGVTTAASETDNGLDLAGVTDGAFRCIRAGTLTGLSVVASAAFTGANCTVAVYKNGTVTALSCLFTDGVTTSATDTDAGISVSAGDLVTVKYTSGAIGNTPAVSAQVELTYS